MHCISGGFKTLTFSSNWNLTCFLKCSLERMTKLRTRLATKVTEEKVMCTFFARVAFLLWYLQHFVTQAYQVMSCPTKLLLLVHKAPSRLYYETHPPPLISYCHLHLKCIIWCVMRKSLKIHTIFCAKYVECILHHKDNCILQYRLQGSCKGRN